MLQTHVAEIVTPKKFLLNGLWFGPTKPERTIILIHGLSSSAFSKLGIVEKLVDRQTAVLTFNNRGHDNVARIGHVDKNRGITAGAAFEKFEECVDDIDGTISFAKKMGAKEIYLAGHSTGCQKAAYWAYKKGRGVKGIILLAPMSDYAGMVQKYGLPKLRAMVANARAMLKSGRENDFVRAKFWKDEPNTPRRYISLYTPDSVEQSIFSYFDPARPAKILNKVRTPILSILAEKDEYADRPASEIVRWFETHTRTPLQSLVVKDIAHSFKGAETSVAIAIKQWILAKK